MKLRGIDISEMQGKVDYSKLKGKVDFVIFRLGYGQNFKYQDDAQVQNNFTGCEKSGIPYGVYLYSYAVNEAMAKSEANHALRLLKGHKPTLPVFYDLEEKRQTQLPKKSILIMAKAFEAAITKAGYTYGTYANLNWFDNYLTDPWFNKHPIWIAQYNNKCQYKKHYDIWQYTSKGRVDGINGDVDMNYWYKDMTVKGDVDGDGVVTAKDARSALRYSAKLENLTDEQKKRADIDGDGKVTAKDARDILKRSGNK